MACDLRCTNCEDNLGKDKENPVVAWCGTCGTQIFNEEGYDWDDLDNEDKQWLKDNGHKKRKSGGYHRIHRGRNF